MLVGADLTLSLRISFCGTSIGFLRVAIPQEIRIIGDVNDGAY